MYHGIKISTDIYPRMNGEPEFGDRDSIVTSDVALNKLKKMADYS